MNQEALDKAVKYLKVRMRSTYEISQFLRDKGFATEDIEEVLALLAKYNYVDDAAYAGAFIRDRLNFNPCGSKKIYAELRKRGVSGDIISGALAENMSAEAEAAAAVKVALKQHTDSKEKLLRYLSGRGFTYAAAKNAAAVWQEARENEEIDG